jgi:hypothetical protein
MNVYNILQQYADIFAQQEKEDPIAKQRRKLLPKNSISLLIRNATYSYCLV